MKFRYTWLGWHLYGKRAEALILDEITARAANERLRGRLDGTLVTLENTEKDLWVHAADECYGDRCTVHKRSDHHMRSWPQHWRGDRGIMERICPDHGVGHPDPDEFKIITGADDGTHGVRRMLRAPMSVLLRTLVVFASALLADVAWARYTLSVSGKMAWSAALWSAGIVGMGVISIDAYIHSRWYVLPTALGAAVGTYYTVRHAKENP